MPSLEGVLANVPGYGGWLAARQMSEQQQMQQLQQAGLLVGLQKHLQEQSQEKAYREGLAALGPNPSQEALAGLSAKYASPKDVLTRETASLDRKASLEAAKAQRAATLLQAKTAAEQTHEARMARLTGDAERRAETARHNVEMEGIKRELAATGAKPPSGYRVTADGNLEAIPGGPADTKLQGAFNQDTAMFNESVSNMDRLAAAANEVKNHPGLPGITGVRGVIPNIPGSQPANAQALLDTLKSQVGFGVLQNMRNNSKTGGALGQVSNIEEKLLQDNLAALGRSQSVEEYRKNLDKIISYTSDAKDRLRSAYNMKHGGRAQPAAPTAAPTVDQLLEKYK